MNEAQIDAVLGALRARDQRLAAKSEAMWESLTWGEGVDVIDQEAVQRFLWYELPLKWAGSPELPSRVAAAAELLDAMGLVRTVREESAGIRESMQDRENQLKRNRQFPVGS